MKGSMWFGLIVALVVIVLDQASKAWIVGFFSERAGEPVAVLTSFLNFVLTGNRGMSFGLFNNNAAMNTAVFTVLAAVIVIALLVWMRRADNPVIRLALGMIIGGAIGNVIDRLTRGAVVDFLDFHLGNWHWYAFNVADAAICLGVIGLLLDGLLARPKAA
ncbi:MAG TPA: signal peptidase II [Stellaceae bacterium]|jgi:signal peptidase II|nr:signal peptidase II [Stellaceae bacterium]